METTESEHRMNTHGAWLHATVEGSKDNRIAGGGEEHCALVLRDRLAANPDRTGYVRALTEDELR